MKPKCQYRVQVMFRSPMYPREFYPNLKDICVTYNKVKASSVRGVKHTHTYKVLKSVYNEPGTYLVIAPWFD